MQYVGTTATGRSRAYRYYTCHTRNRYGTVGCDAPRIDADALDDRVLAAISDFYQTRTALITEAITKAHETYRASRWVVEGELRAISGHIAQKETAADRYFTDYENGKIGRGLLERRIEQIGRELHDLRCHRDRLRLQLDTQPHHLADLDPATVRVLLRCEISRQAECRRPDGQMAWASSVNAAVTRSAGLVSTASS